MVMKSKSASYFLHAKTKRPWGSTSYGHLCNENPAKANGNLFQ